MPSQFFRSALALSCLSLFRAIRCGYGTVNKNVPEYNRKPLQENGWHLVAHMMNEGGSFAGSGRLDPDTTVGTFTWYPTPATPDFQKLFSVVATEIMFVTGDGSFWAITDYPTLRKLIDGYNGDPSANINFLASIDNVVSTTEGNILSRPELRDDPVITVGGNYSAAVNVGSVVVWGGSAARRHDGVNVFVKEQSGRDPLTETGWYLVAHMSNRGGMFSGGGNLSPIYSYGAYTWYPTAATSDFQVEFPVVAKEIMFITGDRSVWAITDYTELRELIDRHDGQTESNLLFLTSVNGTLSSVRGNVYSQTGVGGAPIISISGDHWDGVRSGRIVWGEGNWGEVGNETHIFKNQHGGINIYVRENQHETTAQSDTMKEQARTIDANSTFSLNMPITISAPKQTSRTPAPSLTLFPTLPPSALPSIQPSLSVTQVPSSNPSQSQSTNSPSESQTYSPTAQLTPASTEPLHHSNEFTLRNVSIILDHCKPLHPASMKRWENITIQHLIENLRTKNGDRLAGLDVRLENVNQVSPSSDVLTSNSLDDLARRIPDQLRIDFDLVARFRGLSNDHISVSKYVHDAVDFLERKNEYIQDLQFSGYVDFFQVTGIQTLINGSSTSLTPLKEKDENISLVLFSAAGAFLIVFLFGIYVICNTTEPECSGKEKNIENVRHIMTMSTFQDPQIRLERFVEMEPREEVSTLGEPMCPMTSEMGTVERDDTVFDSASVDYDYRSSDRACDPSVSTVGGTFGEETTRIEDATICGAITANGTIFSDDVSFEEIYFRQSGNSATEDLVDIFVPPGNLGVVIDNQGDVGPPIFFAVKDTSCVAGKVSKGDKLIAVDDEDVRDMTAIKVSKMIAHRSSKSSRKLTILRNEG